MAAARRSCLLFMLLIVAGSLACSSAQRLYPGPERSPADVAVLSLPKSTFETLKTEDGSLIAGKDILHKGGRILLLPGSYVLEGTVFADAAEGQAGPPDAHGIRSTEYVRSMREAACRMRFTAEAGKEYLVVGFNSLQMLEKATGKAVCECEE